MTITIDDTAGSLSPVVAGYTDTDVISKYRIDSVMKDECGRKSETEGYGFALRSLEDLIGEKLTWVRLGRGYKIIGGAPKSNIVLVAVDSVGRTRIMVCTNTIIFFGEELIERAADELAGMPMTDAKVETAKWGAELKVWLTGARPGRRKTTAGTSTSVAEAVAEWKAVR